MSQDPSKRTPLSSRRRINGNLEGSHIAKEQTEKEVIQQESANQKATLSKIEPVSEAQNGRSESAPNSPSTPLTRRRRKILNQAELSSPPTSSITSQLNQEVPTMNKLSNEVNQTLENHKILSDDATANKENEIEIPVPQSEHIEPNNSENVSTSESNGNSTPNSKRKAPGHMKKHAVNDNQQTSPVTTPQLPKSQKGFWPIGVTVWCKLTGHPAWPARTCSMKEIHANALKVRTPDTQLIYFFGEKTLGWAKPANLYPFYGNQFEVFCERASRHRDFPAALKSAKEYEKTVDYDNIDKLKSWEEDQLEYEKEPPVAPSPPVKSKKSTSKPEEVIPDPPKELEKTETAEPPQESPRPVTRKRSSPKKEVEESGPPKEEDLIDDWHGITTRAGSKKQKVSPVISKYSHYDETTKKKERSKASKNIEYDYDLEYVEDDIPIKKKSTTKKTPPKRKSTNIESFPPVTREEPRESNDHQTRPETNLKMNVASLCSSEPSLQDSLTEGLAAFVDFLMCIPKDSNDEQPKAKREKKAKQDNAIVASPTKRSNSEEARIARPRLGEIPQLEHKRVVCQNKTGRIVKDTVVCDCCKQHLSIGEFERHAGLKARRPYQTVFVIESGKPLDTYRHCTYCYTRDTPVWLDGPFGTRTLCNACGGKWRNGEIKEVDFKPLKVASAKAECRLKTNTPAVKHVKGVHLPNVKPLPIFEWKDFTYELYLDLVIKKRQPIVLKNADKALNPELWSLDYLKSRYGQTMMQVRYMETDELDISQFSVSKDAQKSLGWFLNNAENPNPTNDPDLDASCLSKGSKIVMYAKDFSFGEHVPEWIRNLEPQLPAWLIPQNPTHDVMGAPPSEVRTIVWMAYIGADGTRTPLHVDKLATVAFNLHVCGEGTKEWWLIADKEREKLAQLVESQSGNLYKDNFWMAPSELEATGLEMWHYSQSKGDMVIVPPMVPHTVINEGKISCAVAANLLHDKVVSDAFEAEQINRTIGRFSIYRLRNCVYWGVKSEIEKIQKIPTHPRNRLKNLLNVFQQIVDLEQTDTTTIAPQFVSTDDYFTCDKCSCDIFNRRYHCNECKFGDYDLCLQCYKELGKNHAHGMTLHEKIPMSTLLSILQAAQNLCTSDL